MDENNFNDIVLDKNEKSEKLKKILLRTVALAILFLVVLIVMKLLKSDESAENTLFPPEPSANDEIRVDDELDEFAKLKEQIQAEQNLSEQNQSEAFVMPLPSIESNLSKELENQPSKIEAKQEPKAEPKADKPKQTAQKPATQKAATQKSQKPKTPKTPSASTSASGLEKGFYVQIYSVSNFDPKSHEIKKITDNGYEYKSYKTQIKGKDSTRVLVGPFSEAELDAELSKIREKINKEAFKFQVK